MTSSPIDISILVVAFNSRGCIDACLGSIERGGGRARVEVLLVDNGRDGTEQHVSEVFPDVTTIASEGNVGFARANNRLARHAKGQYLLLLNPDAFLQECALDALLDGAARHPEAGAWGGITLDSDGQPDFGNSIQMPSLSGFLSSVLAISGALHGSSSSIESDRPADVLSGGFFMIRRDLWEEMSGLDERFFLYCEEVDLCLRLSQSGHGLRQIAAAKAYHQIAHGNFQSPLRRLYQAAGTMEFLKKHWPLPKRIIAAVLIWKAALLRVILGTLLGWHSDRLATAGKGYRHVALRPGLWLRGYDLKSGLKARLDSGALAD